MRNRGQIIASIIFALIAIGVVYRLLNGAKSIILAVIVFGLIFLLYKYPPNRWARSFKQPFGKRSKRRRKHRFHVIDGKKNDDDPPPFH